MLGQSTTTTTTYADSKLYKASLLASLANNAELVTPTSQYPSVPNFLTSMTGTGTTPTLTPTSLASLEQTFIELQSAPSEGAGAHAGGCEPHTQSGFVPPVVDLSSREQSQDSYDSTSDGEWEPAAKRGRGGAYEGGTDGGLGEAAGQASTPQRKYTRRSRNEKLTPEEEEKRRVRRERNKLAAAKCRQRRVDHTNTLVEETEKLEAEKSSLENEIQTLQQERDQLQFLLQSHQPICKVDVRHTTAAAAAAAFKIKSEPADFVLGSAQGGGGGCTSSSPRLAYTSPSTLVSSSSSCSSSGMAGRPSSLALKSGDPPHHQQQQQLLPLVVSCSTGIPLSTPSSGLYTYTSLDSLVEGSTGLTPLTAGPGPVVSCASQVQRNGGESVGDGVSSPTLVSL